MALNLGLNADMCLNLRKSPNPLNEFNFPEPHIIIFFRISHSTASYAEKRMKGW
jgi:hypothetical protein